MTIWTAVAMTDIDVKTGRDIKFSDQTQINPGNGTETETRNISTTNTGWMLGTGWILFVFSQVMNFIFYKLHPSSPEIWTWGKRRRRHKQRVSPVLALEENVAQILQTRSHL